MSGTGTGLEDDASDSRTASIGSLQTRGRSGRENESQNRVPSRLKSDAGQAREHVEDVLPKSVDYSGSIPADDYENQSSSSSGTDTPVVVSTERQTPSHSKTPTTSSGGIQPSVNWNKSDRGAIRTKLRASGGRTLADTSNGSFDKVNGTYWRSKSSSLSDAEHDKQSAIDKRKSQERSDSQARLPIVISSGDSEASEVTEGDDTMLLNMGSVDHPGELVDANHEAETKDNGANGTASRENAANASENLYASDGGNSRNDLTCQQGRKEVDIRDFNDRYRSYPQTLADLRREDLERQAKYIFYSLAIDKLDLHRPITCTDCFKEGHLADICPDKECVHCGAWATHESRFCPTWRRCQRCRERGHDEVDCSASLRELPSLVPCDLCSSTQHTENDCDLTWKVPAPQSNSGPIFISVSCAYCANTQHLIGDCPRRPFPMNSSSWTLKSYDPSMINTLPTSLGLKGPDITTRLDKSQYSIRGRATERSPSPDSGDALSQFGHSMPVRRGRPHGNIRFDRGIGRGGISGNGLDRQSNGSRDHFSPDSNSRSYRDRDQFFGRNTRQRSLSPRPYSSGRARGGQLPRRPHPHAQQPGARGSSRGSPRGRAASSTRGRRQTAPGDKDTYRPMPSAGKRAWSKHRS